MKNKINPSGKLMEMVSDRLTHTTLDPIALMSLAYNLADGKTNTRNRYSSFRSGRARRRKPRH